jgi:hypothetical protein
MNTADALIPHATSVPYDTGEGISEVLYIFVYVRNKTFF